MNPSRSSTAIKASLAFAALCTAISALAAPAGVVTQASGPLFAQNEQGRIKALSADSAVSAGEMLVTGRETFAQVKFSDGGMLTLGPDTRLAIVAYAYDAPYIAEDRAELRLETGTVRIEPGSLSRRNPERHALVTPTGTIHGGNGSFTATYIASEGKVAYRQPIRLAALSGMTMSDTPILAQISPPAGPTGGLAPGLYVHVIDGIINLSNKGGSQNFAAGQFGYTASFIKPPIVVPNNPGLQFTPPPSFSSSSSPQPNSGSGKSNSVDCEVR